MKRQPREEARVHRLVREAAKAEAEAREQAQRVAAEHQRQADLEALAAIVAHELSTPGMRAQASRCRELLVARNGFAGSSMRALIDRYELAIRIMARDVAEGRDPHLITPEQQARMRARGRNRMSNYRASQEQQRAKLPAFLKGEAEPMPTPPGRR